MNHGYNGSKRFANYVSHAPLPATKRDVTFRKTEPETQPMNAIQKTLAMTIARKNGELTDTRIANQHQTIALEMFPQLPVGKALDAFYKTEVGKIALGYAAQTAYSDLQKSCACGDAYDVVEKGECEISHDHPKQKKQKAKPARNNVGPGVYGTAPDDADGPNRPLNTTPFAMEKRQLALLTDIWASSYANSHRISKSQAYDELMRDEPLFRDGWRAGLVPVE